MKSQLGTDCKQSIPECPQNVKTETPATTIVYPYNLFFYMFNVVYVFCWDVVGRSGNNLGDTTESESKFINSLGSGTK